MAAPEIECSRAHRRRMWLALAIALLGTAAAYSFGLGGDFLFDDYVNLNALGRYGGVDDFETLLYYLTSGIADPTGRPVSMASFLIDARNWPADPFPFKRTNVVIHVLNGALLYSVLCALGGRLSRDSARVRVAALIAAALWLANPLWVSTVLYVVQRHALLATLFVLLGIRVWLASHRAFDSGNGARGWALATVSVVLLGGLAGLSKANGFLLPMLLLVLELTLPRSESPALSSQKFAAKLYLWLPSALLLGWLFWHAAQIGLDGTQGRPWTLAQRLLSQPRALSDYLFQLFVPNLRAGTVFGDSFEASQDLRTPWTTTPALLMIVIMALTAWGLRRRLPILSAAIGFFLVGHILESGVVMLELFFEHRNYLPALLMFWPLAWWVAAPGRFRLLLGGGTVGYLSIMLLATGVQARLWGDPLALALVWANHSPLSARAQAYASSEERAAGRHEAAQKRLEENLRRDPYEPQFAINLLDLRCEQGGASVNDVSRAAASMRASDGLALDLTYHWLSAVLLPESTAPCSQLRQEHLLYLLDSAKVGTVPTWEEDSREMEGRRKGLLAYVALRQRDCEAALWAFDERLDAMPRPEFVQTQTSLLATHCSKRHALMHLNRYLESGAPVSSPSSPTLRLRDRLMQEWWSAHWFELQNALSEKSSNTLR